MVFDDNISNEVSLSRILDQFLVNEEEPSIILNFLELHGDNIADIFQYSDCLSRLMSLEFVAKCSVEQQKLFAKMLDKVASHPHLQEIYNFSWSVLTNTNLDKTTKNILDDTARSATTREIWNFSPYHGKIGAMYMECDTRLYEAGIADGAEGYARMINNFSYDGLMCLLKDCDRSVMVPRMYQEDVFALLEPTHQLMMLNNSASPFHRNTMPVLKGLKQLSCGGLDVEVKKAVCDRLEIYSPIEIEKFICSGEFKRNRGIIQSMDKDETTTQTLMKLEICGDDRLCDWMLLYLITTKGWRSLKSCVRGHRRIFEKYFNILDILEQ